MLRKDLPRTLCKADLQQRGPLEAIPSRAERARLWGSLRHDRGASAQGLQGSADGRPARLPAPRPRPCAALGRAGPARAHAHLCLGRLAIRRCAR
eukprot:11461314-Alexandrium_andersonii.AAC.1